MGLEYYQSFDGLNDGDLVPQDNWYLAPTFITPSVTSLIACAGTKMVEGAFDKEGADRDFFGINNEIHWHKAYMRTIAAAQTFPFIYLGKASTNHAVVYGANNAYWSAFDGNGVGGGAWVSTGVAVVAYTCVLFKVRMDIPDKKWDLYVIDMDTPKLTNLNFRYNTSDSLNWTRIYFSDPARPSLKAVDEYWIGLNDPDIGGKNLISQGFNTNLLLSGRLN